MPKARNWGGVICSCGAVPVRCLHPHNAHVGLSNLAKVGTCSAISVNCVLVIVMLRFFNPSQCKVDSHLNKRAMVGP